MKITIVLPYKNADISYRLWAHEEEKINFRKEKEKATRCTVSFAAEELWSYLSKMGFEVTVSELHGKGFNIILSITEDVEGEAFTYHISENTLTIDGNGRIGVLYGVYEFLEKQGVYWLNPWEEILPVKTESLTMPEAKHYSASFSLDRGYSFDGVMKESELLWLWMARKKLNTVQRRPHTAKLQKKLGFNFVIGEHPFEEILNPDNVMPSGKSLWEEHSDWFGLPENGVKTKENAQSVGFCVSNDELLAYIAERLLDKLQSEWYEADSVAIWGFDTWGGICTCDKCKKLGNGADRTLRLASYLKAYLDNAYEQGKLDRRVKINFSAYEGTSDLFPPINEIPENLKNSNDIASFCPINRCYAHCIDDTSCEFNRKYSEALRGWKDVSIRLNEYYNVSKFEDLPFLFTKTMVNDFKFYHRCGVKGMVYMHVPMLHWDVKNLTQILYAELCWNVDADYEKIINDYFCYRYGKYAEKMKVVYDLMEQAGTYCASWRAWGTFSILTTLNNWDGRKPELPLPEEEHLGSRAAEIGTESVRLYNLAVAMIEDVKKAVEHDYVLSIGKAASGEKAVNPEQQGKSGAGNPYSERLHLDLNYAKYGRDCMELTTLFVMYHEALRTDGNHHALFKQIDELSQKMMGYYIPLRWFGYEIDIKCQDALSRCQLKSLYYRCRAYRECDL